MMSLGEWCQWNVPLNHQRISKTATEAVCVKHEAGSWEGSPVVPQQGHRRMSSFSSWENQGPHPQLSQQLRVVKLSNREHLIIFLIASLQINKISLAEICVCVCHMKVTYMTEISSVWSDDPDTLQHKKRQWAYFECIFIYIHLYNKWRCLYFCTGVTRGKTEKKWSQKKSRKLQRSVECS